jgi:hypothetical protein
MEEWHLRDSPWAWHRVLEHWNLQFLRINGVMSLAHLWNIRFGWTLVQGLSVFSSGTSGKDCSSIALLNRGFPPHKSREKRIGTRLYRAAEISNNLYTQACRMFYN